MSNSLLLDIMALAIIGFSAFVGYKNGFVKTFFKLVVIVLSLFLAYICAVRLSIFLYDNFIHAFIYDKLTAFIYNNVGDFSEFLNQIYNNAFLKDIFKFLNVDLNSFNAAEYTKEAAFNLINSVFYPLIIKFLTFLFTVFLYIFIKRLLGFIIVKLDFVNMVPLIGPINRVLGSALGVCIGVAYVFIFSIILNFYIFISVDKSNILNSETVQNTNIFKIVYNINAFK